MSSSGARANGSRSTPDESAPPVTMTSSNLGWIGPEWSGRSRRTASTSGSNPRSEAPRLELPVARPPQRTERLAKGRTEIAGGKLLTVSSRASTLALAGLLVGLSPLGYMDPPRPDLHRRVLGR